MPAFQSRAFLITINNPAFPAADLPSLPHERYASWQLELAPTTGTPHIHVYAEFTRPVTVAAITRALGQQADCRARLGTREQARDYTRKDDSRDPNDSSGPFERGEWSAGGSGSRNDLAAAVEALKAGGIKRVAEECPTAFVKFSRGLRELEEELEEQPRDVDFVPRPWQKVVLDKLDQPANDRTIYWVTDSEGNKGKSRLARYLCLEKGALQLEGKISDMAYLYNKQPIVIFDISRAQAEHSDHLYSFAEKLKNGQLVSTKYNCRHKKFKAPHVIFFANFKYDETKWSSDRVYHFDLDRPNFAVNLGNPIF